MAEKVSTRDAYGEALAAIGARYPHIVVLDADLEGSTRTEYFKKQFPDRHFEIGISEQDMVTTACGMAHEGKLPFVSTFAIFGSRAWEQIRNTAARANFKVVFVFTHAGLSVGDDGNSAQANEDVAIFRVIPNLRVFIPGDAVETRKIIEWLPEHMTGPVYVRCGREKLPVVLPEDHAFEVGKAMVLREGDDVALLACGLMLSRALQAADVLAGEGIQARVLNCSSIKPLDVEAVLAAARETGGIVTAEEHSVIGGLGSAVAECVTRYAPTRVERVGVQDVFGESGTPDELLEKYGLTSDAICDAAHRVTKG